MLVAPPAQAQRQIRDAPQRVTRDDAGERPEVAVTREARCGDDLDRMPERLERTCLLGDECLRYDGEAVDPDLDRAQRRGLHVAPMMAMTQTPGRVAREREPVGEGEF